MDRQSIKEMLREVIGPNVELVDHPKWVGLHCPLAPWTHEKGSDSSPSAGVSVKDDDTSIYNCFVCGRGTVPWFLRQMEKYTGESYKKLISNIEDGEFLGGSLPEWGSKKVSKAKDVFLGEDYLDLYDDAEGHWYLEDRGIDADTARILQLKIDPEDSHGDERILFPVFSRDKQLYGFTGRAVFDKVEPRIRDYHGLPKARVLLGLHLIRPEDKHIILVEGLFDYAKMVQYDQPAVATMHAGLTDEQANLLIDLGLPVIEMYDNDKAGEDAVEVAKKKLEKYLPFSTVKYPERRSKKGKVICPKDPATLTEEEVEEMIRKAKLL